jgi:putative transposase
MSRLHSHARKLRQGRYSEPNRIYFVTSCTDGRTPIFRQPELARLVLDHSWREEKARDCENLAIVVMPDHFHWLLQISAGRSLQQIVASLKGGTAYKINRLRDQHGKVWQAGFHDHAVRREENLQNLAAYLIQNPVRAGLVSHIDDYPFWRSVWQQRNIRG